MALTLCGRLSQIFQLEMLTHDAFRNPEDIATFGLALIRFRSPLLAESLLMSFPRPT